MLDCFAQYSIMATFFVEVLNRHDFRRAPMRGIDAFYGRAEDESLRLMEEGLEIFHEWGLPTPTVIRRGSLHHDDAPSTSAASPACANS